MSAAAPTLIVWRKFISGKLIAILPEIPGDLHGITCATVDYGARRGAANYHDLLSYTMEAQPKEYGDLEARLVDAGIATHLRAVLVVGAEVHEKRWNDARLVRQGRQKPWIDRKATEGEE